MPNPVFVCIFIFSFEGVGQVDGAEAVGQVFFVQGFDVFEVALERLDNGIGKDGDAVVFAFTVAHDDGMVVKVYVFNAQAHTFHDAQSAAVHNL